MLEYETWSEMSDYRIYDDDIKIIIEKALDWMCYESVWCLKIKCSNGETEDDVYNALNRHGVIYFEDTRTGEWIPLTKERLIIGWKKVLVQKNEKHEIIVKNDMPAAIYYNACLCDEIIQTSLFGYVKYK